MLPNWTASLLTPFPATEVKQTDLDVRSSSGSLRNFDGTRAVYTYLGKFWKPCRVFRLWVSLIVPQAELQYSSSKIYAIHSSAPRRAHFQTSSVGVKYKAWHRFSVLIILTSRRCRHSCDSISPLSGSLFPASSRPHRHPLVIDNRHARDSSLRHRG